MGMLSKQMKRMKWKAPRPNGTARSQAKTWVDFDETFSQIKRSEQVRMMLAVATRACGEQLRHVPHLPRDASDVKDGYGRDAPRGAKIVQHPAGSSEHQAMPDEQMSSAG